MGIAQRWKLHGDGRTVAPGDVVRTDERLHMPYMLGLGGQHILAMSGATALVPVLTGLTGIGDSLVEPLAAAPDPRSRPAPG